VLALAAQRGYSVLPDHVLTDNDIGASEKSKKARPEYERLKRLVRDGTVKAVVFYSNSRLTRRMRELEEWIDLHDRTGVELVSKVSGQDDLGTADGRMVARIKASVDAAEAERISERVKRAFEQRRKAGLHATGGPRPFGYSTSGEDAQQVPVEAEAIRLGASMLMKGGTYGEVMREWQKRGIKPVSAKDWTRTSVRSVYRSARIAGLVTYKGTVVAEGKVPAILDRATWEAVQEAVVHGDLRGKGYGNRTNLLSGYVYCALCGTVMVTAGKEGTKDAAYRCVKGRQGCGGVKRNRAWLDALVDGWVRGRLDEEKAVEGHTEASTGTSEVSVLEQRIQKLRDQHVEGLIEDEDFLPLLSGLRSKLNAARKEEAARVRDTTQKAALQDPVKVWESGDLVERRALLASLVQGIYIKPVGRIGRRPIPVASVRFVRAKE
jgi:DNA invertase Pin-like site-specific DNA recombinase